MALTFGRWLALAVVGIALVPVVVLREPPQRTYTYTERHRLADRARTSLSRAQQAAEQLHVHRIRDSVLESLPRGAAQPVVRIDGALDSTSRRDIEGVLRRLQGTRPARPLVATHVAVVLDSATTVRGHARRGFLGAVTLDYQLPDTAGDPCVVIARVSGRRESWRRGSAAEMSSDVTSERFLGPCAFLEHFGEPGPRIADWLRDRGWRLAQKGAWQALSPPWLPPRWDRGSRTDLQNVMPYRGVSCATRDDADCLAVLLQRPPGRAGAASPDGVVSTADYNPYAHGDGPWYTRRFALGAREWTVLADLARDIGPEKFAAFWRSDLAPPSAFEMATGQSLAPWTRDWIVRTYRPEQTGPVLTADAAWPGGLMVLLGVALALLAARRRQLA